MNILISGNLASLATTLVEQLTRRKHRLVIASDDVEKLRIQSSSIIIHQANPANEIYQDAVSAYGFDIVIYLSSREELLNGLNNVNTGRQLDGLRNTLELCRIGKPKHFFYFSSTEVYGNQDDLSEGAIPEPSSLNGHTLLAGEEYCRMYHQQYGVNVTIIRLTNVYGPGEKCGLLYNLINACQHQGKVSIPSKGTRGISFLHELDVADFLFRAIDEEYTSEALVVNLSTRPISTSDLGLLLQKYFPQTTVNYLENQEIHTKPVKVSAAKKIYDWIDSSTFENELPGIVEIFSAERPPQKTGLRRISQFFSRYPEILTWIELIGGTVIVQLLSQMTGTLIQFKYVDFRLLFVVLMGSIYGIRTGLYAASLMSISILYTWWQQGFDWALLIYNVGNWLPFALYFTAGLITGYYRDKSENQLLNAQKQIDLIHEKYEFLYEVFSDIRALKDEFRERLLGYRESYGKIFTITNQLNALQEYAIYSRALNILEEHMENQSIAIYSLNVDGVYARLEASSIALNGSLTKSLNLASLPELLPHIEKGTIFQNSALLKDYPAYMIPIFNNTYPFNVPTGMIVIWSVKFEQYSTYYYNRLKVICGLIQASLERANLFSNMNYERMYLPGTKILNQQTFMDTLRVRMEMKKNRIYEFQILMIDASNGNKKDVYPCILESIRTNDVIGIGEDGNYYILFSQADKDSANGILDRLTDLGFHSITVDTNQLLLN